MIRNIFLVLLLVLALKKIDAITENETNLVLLQSMFRHGVRTVITVYKNDINQAYWDKYGLGEMTPLGLTQLQDYGIFFRKKYSSFLNPTYHSSFIYARSTDFDRTLQSTMAFLSGVYLPSKDQMWTSVPGQANWMPIPVHTNDLKKDPVLHFEAPCPRNDQLKEQVKETAEYIQTLKDNQQFLKNMSENLGLYFDLMNVSRVADKYVVQSALGLPIESFLSKNVDKIMQLNDLSYHFSFYTDELTKLMSGGLLNNIVENMKSKISGSTKQLYLFGIHDVYMAGMEKLLNPLIVLTQPEYVSSFVFELRNDSAGNYYVQVLFKNNKPSQPIAFNPIVIDGCETLCPYEKFLDLIDDKLIPDYDKACSKAPQDFWDYVAVALSELSDKIRNR